MMRIEWNNEVSCAECKVVSVWLSGFSKEDGEIMTECFGDKVKERHFGSPFWLMPAINLRRTGKDAKKELEKEVEKREEVLKDNQIRLAIRPKLLTERMQELEESVQEIKNKRAEELFDRKAMSNLLHHIRFKSWWQRLKDFSRD